MHIPSIIRDLEARGMSLATDGQYLAVSPSGMLTDADRAMLCEHKAAIMEEVIYWNKIETSKPPFHPNQELKTSGIPPHTSGNKSDTSGIDPSRSDGIRYATHERLADTRRTCRQCRELTPTCMEYACRAAARGELPHLARKAEPDPDRLHRCIGFRPTTEVEDQRSGLVLYPGLARHLSKEAAA